MIHNTDDMQVILKEVSQYEVLDNEEQRRLILKAQKGDQRARDTLIMSNMRFVISFVSKYKRAGIPMNELVSEGTLGLIEAVEKFDLKKNNSFVSYAAFWIRHFVERMINQSAKAVRLPMNKVRLLHQLKREEEILRTHGIMDEAECIEQISRSMNISKEQVMQLKELSQEVVSLDQQTSDDTSNITYLDVLTDNNDIRIDDQVEEKNAKDILSKFISKLPSREASIIKDRYGIGGETLSLSAMSKKYGISKERVRQLEMRGIERLKKLKNQAEMQYVKQEKPCVTSLVPV